MELEWQNLGMKHKNHNRKVSNVLDKGKEYLFMRLSIAPTDHYLLLPVFIQPVQVEISYC